MDSMPAAKEIAAALVDNLKVGMWSAFPVTGVIPPELDTEGAAINGKEGLMQTVTVMPFVDKGDAVMAVELVNRVESYA